MASAKTTKQEQEFEDKLSACARAIEAIWKERGEEVPLWIFGEVRYRLRSVLKVKQ